MTGDIWLHIPTEIPGRRFSLAQCSDFQSSLSTREQTVSFRVLPRTWQLRELQASTEMADRTQMGTLQGLCLYTELTGVSFSEGREPNPALCGEKQKRHVVPFLFQPGHVQHATLFLSSSNPLVLSCEGLALLRAAAVSPTRCETLARAHRAAGVALPGQGPSLL